MAQSWKVKMNRVLLVLVLSLAAMKCSGVEMGEVSFSRTSFTMTCPTEESVKWSRGNPSISNTLTLTYDDTSQGEHKCSYGSDVYYFYVQGKVCENCFELDTTTLFCCIIVDLLVTGGIIILIYNCAQRKSGPSPAPPAIRPGNRNAPSVPDRDYEPLNIATRDTSTYAVAGVHRTG